MSRYKILEEVPGMSRFQLVQRAADRLELRLIADDKKAAFEAARSALLEYFESKGVTDVDVAMSDDPPMADKVSGKFKHVCKEL